MTKSFANTIKKGKVVQHFSTIVAYLCGVLGDRDCICKNYTNKRVNFTHWHSSCYRKGQMSTVR